MLLIAQIKPMELCDGKDKQQDNAEAAVVSD
jgi:hypothetical protein